MYFACVKLSLYRRTKTHAALMYLADTIAEIALLALNRTNGVIFSENINLFF